jgi:hypothetical protein
MFLTHALSQLAILGATSIVLRDGCVVPFAEADDLLAKVLPCKRFLLRARESYVDVIDDGGQLFGRAVTLWRADDRRAIEQVAVQTVATSLQAGGTTRS